MAAHSRPFGSALGAGIVHHAAAVDVARYVGEPVCVVVARDRYIAEDAAERVLVDYEPLPVAASVEAAMAEGAPVLHDALGSNVAGDRAFSYGDPDAAFARRRPRRARALPPPALSATPVECYGVIADWTGRRAVTAWANFQGPFTLHGVAAAALGIRAAKLRLLTPAESGGSFGDEGGRAALGRADGDRVAAPRRAGALDGGSRRAPARRLDGDRADERGGGRVRRRRPPARRCGST